MAHRSDKGESCLRDDGPERKELACGALYATDCLT